MLKRMVLISLVLSLIASSCQLGSTSSNAESIKGEIDREGGALVEHPSGLTITIPPGAL